eukprot:scaffold10972_cov127-Isochrysis_galbana.AAC.1
MDEDQTQNPGSREREAGDWTFFNFSDRAPRRGLEGEKRLYTSKSEPWPLSVVIARPSCCKEACSVLPSWTVLRPAGYHVACAAWREQSR